MTARVLLWETKRVPVFWVVWLPCGGFKHAHFTFHGFCFLAGPPSRSWLSRLPTAPTAASLRARLRFLLIWSVLFTWRCGLACLFPSSVGHFVLRCVWNKSLRPGTLPCGQGFGRLCWAPADSSSGGAELPAEARSGGGAPLGPLVGRVCLPPSEPGLPAAPPEHSSSEPRPLSLSLSFGAPHRSRARTCRSAVASARRSSVFLAVSHPRRAERAGHLAAGRRRTRPLPAAPRLVPGPPRPASPPSHPWQPWACVLCRGRPEEPACRGHRVTREDLMEAHPTAVIPRSDHGVRGAARGRSGTWPGDRRTWVWFWPHR